MAYEKKQSEFDEIITKKEIEFIDKLIETRSSELKDEKELEKYLSRIK